MKYFLTFFFFLAYFNFGKIYANTNFTIENSNNNLGVLSNHDKKLYESIFNRNSHFCHCLFVS